MANAKKNSDELIEIDHPKYSYIQRFIFEILDLAHNRYIWSESAKYRWKRKDFEAKKKKKS